MCPLRTSAAEQIEMIGSGRFCGVVLQRCDVLHTSWLNRISIPVHQRVDSAIARLGCQLCRSMGGSAAVGCARSSAAGNLNVWARPAVKLALGGLRESGTALVGFGKAGQFAVEVTGNVRGHAATAHLQP